MILNVNNPIGMKGELAISFAILAKKMWYGGEQTQQPWQFKKVMGKMQNIVLFFFFLLLLLI